MRASFAIGLAFFWMVGAASAQGGSPLPVSQGGTGASTANTARANLGAAGAGSNTDITSLSGLTTPLSTVQGGTGSTGGISPTGSLTTTPETVINIADYGGCSGSPTSDTANLNAALSAARTSTAYTNNQPVRVTGGFSASNVACAVTQINATGFTRFGAGSRLILEDVTLNCAGTGNICLDALGSLNIQYNKVTIIGSSTSPPMIGMQEGNTSPSTNACCIHTHYGLEITGSFSFAGLYSAASESTTYYSPIIRNNGASFGVITALGTITGGSGYTNGTYPNVTLTGSSTGIGAVATIVVSAGAVTKVTLTNQGKQFAIGNTLTANPASIGGTGTNFSVPVSNIGQFAMVMDGQNHWGVSSSFQTVSWTADTYYTFTENNIIGGSLRYYGGAYGGAPLWMGSVEGLRTVHTYVAQQAAGACVLMFDNNATYTLHNINETLEIECETANATYDVELTGSNAAPNINGLTLVDQLSTVNTAILGLDVGITSVSAHNANIKIGFNTTTVPLFAIGTAALWNLDGVINMPTAQQYNAPNSLIASGVSNGVPVAGSGPLDLLNSTASVSAAYSCARRLTFSYAGALCNIRRASDSMAIDLYSATGGTTDVTAISAFCASTNCYIAKMYDQSGNGNNATNATTTTQPILVLESAASGTAICGTWGNGSSIQLTVAANSSINNLFASGGFASIVVNKTATITNSMRLISKLASGTGWEWSGAYSTGYGYPQFTVDSSGSNGAWVSSSFMPSFGFHVIDIDYSYASLSNVPTLAIDGSILAYQSTAQPTGTINDTNNLTIGNNSAGSFGWPGDICEVILAKQSLSAAAIEAIRRNEAVFYRIANVL